MKNPSNKRFSIAPVSSLIPAVIAILLFLSSQTAWCGENSPTPLSDDELSEIYGSGLLFRVDLSLEVLSASDTLPTVVVNTGTPITIPTSTTSGASVPAGGNISLSGNAQSNVSSLINVIGSASVINVGLNIVSITNSSSDTIYTTNINTGAQGSGFTMNVPLLPF